MDNKRLRTVVACLVLLAGCSRSPSIDILGSFFPAWIICCLAGILLAVATYLLLRRLRVDTVVPLVVLTYPCLAALYTFVVWLIFYS